MWTALTNICLLQWKIRTSSALEMIKLFWLFFCWKIPVYQKRNRINRDLLEAAVLPKNFSWWFLAVSQLPRRCWWCQATFALYLTWGPGTFQLESLGPGVLIQKFRLRGAALWDFQFLSESSHFQDDRSLRDAAVQGLEPRQDTQPPWKKGLQSLHPPGKHRAVGEIHTALHGRWRNRWSKWNCQGNLGSNPIAQVISFACSCDKFYGILSTLNETVLWCMVGMLSFLRYQNPLPITLQKVSWCLCWR